MTLPTNVHWCSVYMELQICERDVYIKDCLLLVLDQKPLGLLFNLFKTQYTFEKGHWLANIYEAFVCARTRVQTENIIYLHNLHKLLWRHITRFVPALRRRSLPPVFPRGWVRLHVGYITIGAWRCFLFSDQMKMRSRKIFSRYALRVVSNTACIWAKGIGRGELSRPKN